MKKVLVVDDEISITDGLTALFQLDEIAADGAYDRETAEQMLEEEFYPVIVADLRLKTEADGLMLLDAIRRLSPNSKVATLTAFATPEVEEEIKQRGSSVVLRKPMGFDEIVEVIGEMLQEIEAAAAEMEAATGTVDLDQLYADVRRVLYYIPQRRFGLNAEEADDLVQEAWLLFLEKRGTIQMSKPWLTGTMVNLCKQKIHRNARTRDLTCDIEGDDERLPAVNGLRHVDTMMLQQAMSRLDARSRDLCNLIGLEGWSYEEVSGELGLPLGSVGPLYIRAKSKLKKALNTSH